MCTCMPAPGVWAFKLFVKTYKTSPGTLEKNTHKGTSGINDEAFNLLNAGAFTALDAVSYY